MWQLCGFPRGNVLFIPFILYIVLEGCQVQPATGTSSSESKRAIPPQVAEKGLEIAEKALDKQLEIAEEQQKKVDEFVSKEVELDIDPQKGWQTEDLVVPAGLHITSRLSTDKVASEPEGESAERPSVYPFGVGGVLMNGCYGTGYEPGDPCYSSQITTTLCLNLIDGAAFIGVGFDGRGEYSSESRKMSIVQRSCAGRATYDGFDVPDTMNVQGIYDTRGYMSSFFSRSEYQSYLQQQAGVGGSAFGFYGGVRRAYGGSFLSGSQLYLAVFDLDIDRYEMHIEEVKPEDLSVGFLREFMDLPTSIEDGEDYNGYQNFIQRWGTHFIKSAKFGGELEIRKTIAAAEVQSKTEFSETMEAEFKSLFTSFSSKKETKGGSSFKAQAKSSSLSFSVQGGSHEIALLVTDIESPTIKQDMENWLKSIPDYPKPYKFTMAPITDLVNFNVGALFKGDSENWGCEGHKDKLVKDEGSDRMYYIVKNNGTETKKYCDYLDRLSLAKALEDKRKGLKRAIEIYLEEGTISTSDFSIKAGQPGCQSKNEAYQAGAKVPTWKEITEGQRTVRVIFDMASSLDQKTSTQQTIKNDQEIYVRYRDGQWESSDDGLYFHFYDRCALGNSGEVNARKMCIRKLVLQYNVVTGELSLNNDGFELAKDLFTPLPGDWKGMTLARVEYSQVALFNIRKGVGYLPCNIEWSNVQRFHVSSGASGKCLSFAAASTGNIYVVFAAVPAKPSSWYYFEIAPEGVGIFKSQKLQVSTVDPDAVSLGDRLLYQNYFVCLTTTEQKTTLEFGKFEENDESKAKVYLLFADTEDAQTVRFYAFGSGERAVQVVDAHIIPRESLLVSCEGDAVLVDGRCRQTCHELCDPEKGCRRTAGQEPQPTECNACRFLKLPVTGECVKECPGHQKPDDGGVFCVPEDCAEYYKDGVTKSGVYSVDPDGKGAFQVYCDMATAPGGWTVLQRRQDGSHFDLKWREYKAGFGQLTGEFWLGLDKIHRLTDGRPKTELRVDIEDSSGDRAYAKYGSFGVGDEQSQYKLSVGSYSGTAGDALSSHDNSKFTTKDKAKDTANYCSQLEVGGWWFPQGCFFANLNGKYLGGAKYRDGVSWFKFKNNWSPMTFAEMKLRERK